MITLVEGLPAADTVVHKYIRESVLILGPFDVDNVTHLKAGNIELRPETKLLLLILSSRLLNITTDDYKILRTVLAESGTLQEFLEKARDQPFSSPRLATFVDYLTCTMDSKDMSRALADTEKAVLDFVIAEPYSTILSLVYLCELYREGLLSKFSAVFIITSIIEEILDLLLQFRNLRLHIISLTNVYHLRGLVDEYVTSIVQLPQDKPRIVRLCAGKISEIIPSNRPLKIVDVKASSIVEKLSDVEREILQMLCEMNFMSLGALRDAVSQNLGIDKSEVDRAVLRLERKGLVQIKVLPDGRVMVYPTVLGLVKAKEKST